MMKKAISFIFSVVFLYSCGDTGIEVVSYSDYSSDLSYKVGSPRDKRLSFFDINEFKQLRTIPNNLSMGSLAGRVQFAQTHTIDPNNNEARKEPSLIPYRAALLLFTPQEELSTLTVKVHNGTKSQSFEMVPPIDMPKSDYTERSGSKPDIIYSKRSWSVQLPYDYITPKIQLDFEGETKQQKKLSGILFSNDIEFAAPMEGVFLFIQLGMLTDIPGTESHLMLEKPAQAMQEYFQTVPFAKLVNGSYEDMRLKKVIINDGTIYVDKSSFVGADRYSGDMRASVAKSTVSVGINLANKGIASSAMNDDHQIWIDGKALDMFYFMVHHARGKYSDGQGGIKEAWHGLSGGNGIGTLVNSSGNEFSHEVGHGYSMGHYPFLNEASDGSIHGYTTSWGYDAYKHRMRANIAWNSSPQAVMYQDKWYITPFQNYYGWNRDCMAGGVADSAISRYTHNTARSTRQVQKNLEYRYFLSDTKNENGEYYYIGWDKEKREYKHAEEKGFLEKRAGPAEKGVPVITILGGYDPDDPDKSLIYPYFRGNWGNVFSSLFFDNLPADATSYLEITYYDGKESQYVVLSDKRFNEKIINKLHLNIAESDKPKTVTLYVNKINKGFTTIDEAVYDNPLPKPVIIGMENGYADVLDDDIKFLQDNMTGKTIDNLTAKNKELIAIFDRYKVLDNLTGNVQKTAKEYMANKKKIDKINKFIDENYTSLENDDTSADESLKKMFKDNGLGTVSFKFNQAILNGKCMEVFASETNDKSLRLASTCNESKEQRWAIDKAGRIHSAIYPGYCLDKKNMSVLNPCSDDTGQKWKIRNPENIANGVVYESIAENGKCIDNSGGNSDKIIIYNCSDGTNQQFKQNITEDDNLYFSLFNGSLIEEVWKYIPENSGE